MNEEQRKEVESLLKELAYEAQWCLPYHGAEEIDKAREKIAIDEALARIEKVVVGAELRGMDMVNDCHGCVDCGEWLSEHRDELEQQLDKSNDRSE